MVYGILCIAIERDFWLTTCQYARTPSAFEDLVRCLRTLCSVTWENIRHFATPTLLSPRNDVWETRAEIGHWWRVTSQIWVALLIGWWSKFPANQKHYPDQGSDPSSLCNFLARSSGVISILVPRASWGPEQEDQAALGTQDLKS